MVCLSFMKHASGAPGDFDPTFGLDGRVFTALPGWIDYRARTVKILDDGKLLVAGTCANVETEQAQYGACIVRYDAYGLVDATFGINGQAFMPFNPIARSVVLAVRPNGKVLVAAACYEVGYKTCVGQFDANGTPDPLFGNAGVARFYVSDDYTPTHNSSLLVEAGGTLVVGGFCEISGDLRWCLVRLNEDGSRGGAFTVVAFVRAYVSSTTDGETPSLLETPSGQIIVASSCATATQTRFCAVRYLQDGRIDTGFGVNGLALVTTPFGRSSYAKSAVQQPNGGIVIAGLCSNDNGPEDSCVARFTPSGRVDAAFGVGGIQVVTTLPNGFDGFFGVTALPSNEVLGAGYCYVDQQSSETLGCVARFTATGLLDVRFAVGGSASLRLFLNGSAGPMAVTSDPSGRVIIASECHTFQEWTDKYFCLARLKGGPYLASACTLNADANNTIAASSDVMLVTRYLLGFRGDALTVGAIGAGSTKTAGEIATYLDSLKNDPLKKLDLDGDGESLAMTDGLLMLRAMLGLSGDALTTGAIGKPSAAYPTLRSAQQILQWIETTHGVACLP